MCGPCNRLHNSTHAPYLTYMREHYGSDVVDELRRLRMSLQKVTDDELRVLLCEFKAFSL